MQKIDIFTENGADFHLRFVQAISDENAYVRADNHLFLYQLYRNGDLLLPYFFIDKFTFFPEQKTVLLQEYPTEFAASGSFSALLFLRITDLKKSQSAKISRLQNGRFVGKSLEQNRLIFEKKYPGRTEEFEISTSGIVWEKFTN